MPKNLIKCHEWNQKDTVAKLMSSFLWVALGNEDKKVNETVLEYNLKYKNKNLWAHNDISNQVKKNEEKRQIIFIINKESMGG